MKCLIKAESETMHELERELNKVGVKLGYVGEVVEYVERWGIIALAKVKLPYFESEDPFDKECLFYKHKKGNYIEVLLPYDCIAEVEDEIT